MEQRFAATTREKPLTITDLTQLVKGTLEHFPPMYVVGEISNFKQASSGHWYFSLKDAGAQIRCNMWRTFTRNVQVKVGDGAQVLVRGTFNVYAPRGEYSLVVESIEELGLGRLRQAFERLKAKLQAEGLFERSHKKSLPLLPRKIGVVTSPTGAALRDILRVLQQRFAGIHVLIFPARVQGEGAAQEIAQGIEWLDRNGACDLLIIGRGGGSDEDLFCFNDETLARAIFAARTPIISAVGHEVDFTIADFVADVRAATPSNAAEMAVRSHVEYKQNLTMHLRSMERSMQRQLLKLRNRVNISESHPIFVQVRSRLNDVQRRLTEAEHRMSRALANRMARHQKRLNQASRGLRPERLAQRLGQLASRLSLARSRMDARLSAYLERLANRLMTYAHRLDDLSPLKILNRGYAAVFNRKNALVRDPDDVSFGEVLRLRVARGEIHARVIEPPGATVQDSLFE